MIVVNALIAEARNPAETELFALALRAQAGDCRAFAALTSHPSFDRMTAWVRKRFGWMTDFEDVEQAFHLRLWSRLDYFDPNFDPTKRKPRSLKRKPPSLITWARTMFVRCLITSLKAAERQRKYRALGGAGVTARRSPLPDAEVEARKRLQSLDGHVAALPPTLQATMKGLIADELSPGVGQEEVNDETLKSRLARARLAVRVRTIKSDQLPSVRRLTANLDDARRAAKTSGDRHRPLMEALNGAEQATRELIQAVDEAAAGSGRQLANKLDGVREAADRLLVRLSNALEAASPRGCARRLIEELGNADNEARGLLDQLAA